MLPDAYWQQQVHNMLIVVLTAYIDGATAEGRARKWDLGALWSALRSLYPVGVELDSLPRRSRLTRSGLLSMLSKDIERAFAQRETEIEQLVGVGAMRQLERDVLFEVIDRKWREHLYEMDYLKEGIGLRAMAQRDPVVEYQTDGYDMFVQMLEGAKEECVRSLFNATIKPAPAAPADSSVAPIQRGRPAPAPAAVQGQPGGSGRHERMSLEPASVGRSPDSLKTLTRVVRSDR